MPYVEDDQMYGICEPNHTLGDLGPGFPLFFEFIKYMGYLMLALTLIYFLPCVSLIAKEYEAISSNLQPTDNKVALMSIGIFIQHADKAGYEKLDWDSRSEKVQIYLFLLFLSIFLTFIFIICIRASLLRMYSKLDKDAYTPSDYCCIGYNMVFDDYHPKAMADAIKASFAEKYGMKEDDIIYINPCFDIGDFYDLTAKLTKLTTQKASLEGYFEKNKDVSPENLNVDELPDDYPHRSTGICGKEPLILSQLESEIKEVEGKQDEIAKHADMDENTDPATCEERFTHTVFVVLRNPRLANVIQRKTSGFRLWKTYAPSCLISNEDRWYWERAPEPSDVQFENLKVSTC